MDRTRRSRIQEANYYYFIESCLALLVSFIINVFVVATFAYGLYNVTNAEVVQQCEGTGLDAMYPGIFPVSPRWRVNVFSSLELACVLV